MCTQNRRRLYFIVAALAERPRGASILSPPARLPSRHFVIYYRGRFGACVSIILIYTKQSRERRRRSNDNEGEREECAATAPASINSQPQRQRSDAPPFFPFVLVKRSRDFSERPRKSAERREGRNRLITLHVEGERERGEEAPPLREVNVEFALKQSRT